MDYDFESLLLTNILSRPHESIVSLSTLQIFTHIHHTYLHIFTPTLYSHIHIYSHIFTYFIPLIYLTIIPNYLSIHLFIYPCIHLSIFLSIYFFIYLPIYLSICYRNNVGNRRHLLHCLYTSYSIP
jgi:hypothetical protein